MKWLIKGLSWKIIKTGIIPVLVSHPKQVWNSQKTDVTFLLSEGFVDTNWIKTFRDSFLNDFRWWWSLVSTDLSISPGNKSIICVQI